MQSRQQLIDAARAYKGTKWRHQGRSRTGIDCAGLIVCALKDIGIEVPDRTDYQRRTSGQQFMAHFTKHGIRKHPKDMAPGDVLVFREPAYPCHCAILTEKNGEHFIIHAHARRKKVVEEHYAHEWLDRLIAVYQVPGIGDGLHDATNMEGAG